MLDVSVVVPFYNPGANIDDCMASLLDQTIARDRYEIVLVDDGSTDGSDQRALRYVDANPELVRLHRIPASGWPGRPRNVGVDAAHGRYVQFVDSDDALHPDALERLVDIALASDADIVVGKLTSDFRGLYHPVFRTTVTGRTIHDYPLIETLTPHKMVRRALLAEHDIRFAEGPRHVEDEHFSMQTYTRAKSVAVVGDLPCYFYRRRRVSGRNLGDVEAAPADYYRDLATVLDVIDDNVADPAARVPLQRRFYRNEMLGRLRGSQMGGYPTDFRQDLFDRVRALAATRFAPEVREGLGCFVRTQSRLVIDNEIEAATSYAEWLAGIKLHATAATPVWRDGRLAVDVFARLEIDGVPVVFDRDGEDWCIPQAAAPGVPVPDRLVTGDDLAAADLDCATVSREDSQLWSTTKGLSLVIAEGGQVHISGTVRLDPLALRGGKPLAPGLWDLRLRVMFGGLTITSALRPAEEPESISCNVLASDGVPIPVRPYWTSPHPMLALDVDEWSHPLTDLIDDTIEPTMTRRNLELALPAITGATAELPAQLLLVPADELSPATAVTASAKVTTTGATLVARLPRSAPGSEWLLYARIGGPGGPPPHRLAWTLKTQRRHLTVKPATIDVLEDEMAVGDAGTPA